MQPLIDSDFKEVENQPGYYISRSGKLYSNYAKKFLGGYVGENGYLYYTFKDHSREYAHRLVAKAFIPNPDNKPEVNHKDYDRLNDNEDNLEWSTTSENLKHAHSSPSRKKIKSYRHANTKLSDADIIRIFVEDGPLITIAAKYGTSPRTVFNIKKGVRHSRVTKEVATCRH
jgi:hypothetical protein